MNTSPRLTKSTKTHHHHVRYPVILIRHTYTPLTIATKKYYQSVPSAELQNNPIITHDMAQFFSPPPPQQSGGYSAQNLQFYPSSYGNVGGVSGHTTPSQGYGAFGGMGNIGTTSGMAVTGAAGERGGLTMGWLAAFGTGGYDDEPPLLEELGVNFTHIKGKVRCRHRSLWAGPC
jgi:hypothetical protein